MPSDIQIDDPDSLIPHLLKKLHQEDSTVLEIREILDKVTRLSFINVDFALAALDKFLMALRGNSSLRQLQWLGGKNVGKPAFQERKNEIYTIIKDKLVNYKGEPYWLPGGASARQGQDEWLKPVTVCDPLVFFKGSFKIMAFTSSNTSHLVNFKFRMGVDQIRYPNLLGSIEEIIFALNKKYAADLFSAPIQQAHAFFEREKDERNIGIAHEVLTLLLSDKPEKMAKVRAAIEILQDQSFKEKLITRMNSSSENLKKELQAVDMVIEARERMATISQMTLYPLSHHHPQDVRLLFFLRDLEIEMQRRGIPPTTDLALNDTVIGPYLRFRIQVPDSGGSLNFSSSEQIAQLKRQQETSPHYLFFRDRGFPTIYPELFKNTSGGLLKKIRAVLACPNLNSNSSALELSLLKQLQTNLEKNKRFTPEHLLEAYDHLLLQLQDRLEPISDSLFQLSHFFDNIFAEARLALVASSFGAIKPVPMEELPPSPQFFQPTLTAKAMKQALKQAFPDFAWKASTRNSAAWVHFPNKLLRDKAKNAIQTELKTFVPQSKIVISDACNPGEDGKVAYAVLLQGITLAELRKLVTPQVRNPERVFLREGSPQSW